MVQSLSQQLLIHNPLYQEGVSIVLLFAGPRLVSEVAWVLNTGVVGTKFAMFFDFATVAEVIVDTPPLLPAFPLIADERRAQAFPGAGLQIRNGLVMAFSGTPTLYDEDLTAVGAFGAVVV